MLRSSGRGPHWIVASVSLVVVASSTVVAVHDEPAAHKTHTTAAARPAAAKPPAHKVDFGLAYGDSLMVESAPALAKSLNDAVSVGAGWIRMDLPWDAVQTTGPDSYDWRQLDLVVSDADARGLHIDAVLDAPPSWARESSCKALETCPPADFGQFAGFAAAAAARYAPKGLHTWEVWNEPNIQSWAPAPNPKAYTELLETTSKALRKADPHAFVVFGGMAAVVTDSSQHHMSPYDFLDATAADGATKYVDAVAYHPYSAPTLPSAAANFQTVSSARDNLVAVLEKYGTPDVPVWLTETGAPLTGIYRNLKPSVVDNAPALATQAAYATDLVQTVAANDHVGADFWYSDTDSPSSGLYFGLRDADGTARPAFDAFKNAIAACGCSAN